MAGMSAGSARRLPVFPGVEPVSLPSSAREKLLPAGSLGPLTCIGVQLDALRSRRVSVDPPNAEKDVGVLSVVSLIQLPEHSVVLAG